MTPLLAAEIVVVVAAGCAALRIALKPPLLRELRAHKAFAIKLLAPPLAGGIFVLWAASQWPAARHGLAASSVLAMAAAWWRARPSYGRLRRLPPGSLGMGQSLDAIDDRRFYFDQARRWGPVFKMSQFGQPVICVLGLERGQRLLSGLGTALAGATLPHNRLIPSGFLRFMHAEAHKAIAPLFRASFASVVSAQYEGPLRAIYREALALLAADSAPVPEGVNARPYLERAVFESLAWLLYGLAPGDPRVERLSPLIAALHPADPGGFAWRSRTRATLKDISAVMLDIQQDWAGVAGVPPSALKCLVDSVPEAIANPVYAWNFAMITRIAHGDVSGLNDWILKMCCDYPGALDAVRRASERDIAEGGAAGWNERAAGPSPALCIVMETLRLEQSEFLYRRVAKPCEFEGFVLPKGWLIRLLVQESHRDPSVFEDPGRFDPQRFLRRRYSRSEYAPFGADAHGCMGFQLAQLIGSILVEELARYDCQMVSDGPLERGNRHRHHWRPSPRFRVRLMSRQDARDPD